MHDITLRLEVSSEPAIAKIDAERMKQVLSNLISNAVKFSSAGQEVVVRVERAGARIRVSVIDSGAGIAKEAHARIFDEFEQAGEAGGELQKGTGLGLTICRSIVQLHGSKIGLESEPGRGSTFYFDLHTIAGDGAQRAKAA
jgi:signal transduction histidine kinase